MIQMKAACQDLSSPPRTSRVVGSVMALPRHVRAVPATCFPETERLLPS